jgi:crotonobetainyl-CoA:carnitine CoA-transferase CaiB-like acyl-CoA transferase
LRDVLGTDDPTVDGMSYDWFSEEVRKAHQANVETYEKAFHGRSTAAWIQALDRADVPCARVNFPEEVWEDPHVIANALMLSLEHPVLGPLRMPAPPMRMSGTPPGSPLPPPALGQHGPAILRELGFAKAEVERLVAEGVAFAGG